jgi:N-acyl-D-amino-acid deacylase
MFDLLIKNGMIVDGTGSPGFHAAIGVKDNAVTVLRGDVSAVKSHKTIDATGRIVAPGFIDVHAHSALMILSDPDHLAKVHQGITTELFGIDGNSYAPFADVEDLKRMIQINSGLEGSPELPGYWSSIPEYLDMYDRKVSVNVAYIVGNSPLRVGAMGWDNRPPSASEMDRQKGLLRESMQAGAFGMSTGLDYPPGSYADTDELVELSKVVADEGGFYHTHVRFPLGDGYLDPNKEALEIGRRSGSPIHITHLLPGGHGEFKGARPILDLVESAREKEGMDVTFDCFPYSHGGTRLIYFLPQWVADGGPEKIMEGLRDPETRALMKREMNPAFAKNRGGWDSVMITYFKKPHNRQFEGKTLAQAGEIMGTDPVEALFDLVLDEDLQPSFHAEAIDPETMPLFVQHPLQMVGSDALLLGDFPPAMAYGTFPVIIAKYVREEGRISLPEAIRKMTSFPAQRLDIPDRGILRNGFKGDIVVFDYENISAPATRYNPKQYSLGVDYVIVNGEVVVYHGKHTGAHPGRALRRGQAGPQ